MTLDKADRVPYLGELTRQNKPRRTEGTMRILAVEDEPEYLEMLQEYHIQYDNKYLFEKTD